VAWLGPITTALAYMLFVHGLRGVDAPTAGTLSLAEPLVAALLGIGLLHERLTDPAVTGCALLAAGLLITAVPLPSRASGAAPDAVDQRGGQAPCARARSHPAARTARRTESRP
jgi:DME family drug/metabolite transporter